MIEYKKKKLLIQTEAAESKQVILRKTTNNKQGFLQKGEKEWSGVRKGSRQQRKIIINNKGVKEYKLKLGKDVY